MKVELCNKRRTHATLTATLPLKQASTEPEKITQVQNHLEFQNHGKYIPSNFNQHDQINLNKIFEDIHIIDRAYSAKWEYHNYNIS